MLSRPRGSRLRSSPASLLLPPATSPCAHIPSLSTFLRLARAHVQTHIHTRARIALLSAPTHVHGGGINSLAQISTPGACLRFQAFAPTPTRPTFILSAVRLGAEKRGMGTRHAARTILLPRRHLPSRTTPPHHCDRERLTYKCGVRIDTRLHAKIGETRRTEISAVALFD